VAQQSAERHLNEERFMKRTIRLGGAVLAAAALAFSIPASAQETLTVWWVKGFYKSEDDALYAAIKKYEGKSGVKVELSQYAVQDGIPKTVSALDAGTPPDVAYIDVYDFQVTGKWAYDGKLEDLSDVLTPMKDRFLKNTLETTYLYNDKTRKKAYYAFPLKQQTMHIQYWKDMLAEAGLKESDVPTGWKAYWDFWCDKVQPAHRSKTGKRTYAVGHPMGVDSSDSFYSFLTFMDAYNVKLVDDNGKLLVDDPKTKAGLVNAVRDYSSIRTRTGRTPTTTSRSTTRRSCSRTTRRSRSSRSTSTTRTTPRSPPTSARRRRRTSTRTSRPPASRTSPTARR
jgi:multiple sugar transport system substrate-binding protein